MNKDVTGTTAMDAAAAAIARLTETNIRASELSPPPPPTPPAPSDVVELSEHYETDAELAELSVRLLNLSQGLSIPSTYEDEAKVERAVCAQRTAALPTLVLMSRALMRSAAAQERTAAVAERNERRLLETRETDEEARKLHLANLRLQNQAFTGEIERLTMLAQLAIGFASNMQAQALDNGAVPAEVIGEFVSSVRALSSGQAGVS